jgi:hypothetical protein
MLRRHFHKRRIDFLAAINSDGAARLEAAARRDVERIGHGHNREQRFGVGMLRIA